jgi:polysaccharide biosynthesis/export protein
MAWHARPVSAFFLLAVLGAPCVRAQGKTETQQQTNEKIEQLAALATARPAEITIGSSDLLHIDVFDVPELSRDVRVSDTGEINYPPIVGRIRVAGLTAFQLEDKLAQLLTENGLVSHPQVSVLVREVNSQPIAVVGAVGHPMIYQAAGPTTLLQVLLAAGGIASDAGTKIVITRPSEAESAKMEPASETNQAAQGRQTITIPLQDLVESGNPAYNIPVYGGDIVSIPRAGIVYVLGGGIVQPGGYVLQSWGAQITVLNVVALAHGLTAFAKADNAVILRTNPATGLRDEIPVRIQQVIKNKTPDVPLLANDILIIPDNTSKKVLVRGAQSALGIGTSIAVYRISNQ